MEINKLSNELLLEIFDFLDKESLRSASIVCKRWDHLMNSSATIMKKFILKLDPQRIERLCGDDLCFRQHHYNLNIWYGDQIDSVVNTLERFNVSQVRFFEVFGPEAVELSKLLKILTKMPVLEKMIMQPHEISIDEETKYQQINLPEIKIIKTDTVNTQILQFLKVDKLSQLSIGGYRVPTSKCIEAFVEFLMRSPTLKVLDLNEQLFINIFNSEDIPKFPFLLKKFSIEYSFEMKTEHGENFSTFLKSQPLLADLQMGFIWNIPKVIYKTIFTKLEHLSNLEIDVSCLPTDRNFYDQFKPLLHLKRLMIKNEFPNENAVKGFMGNCPQIEKLKCYDAIKGDELNYVSMFNKNIKKMNINQIKGMPNTDCKFENLKKLSIRVLNGTESWMAIISSSVSIESIKVEYIESGDINEPVMDFLLQQPSLRHLKFSGEYEDMKIIFDKFKVNYGKFKTLDLTMSNTSEYGTTVTADVIFNFPENHSEWKIEEQEKKFDEAWSHRTW